MNEHDANGGKQISKGESVSRADTYVIDLGVAGLDVGIYLCVKVVRHGTMTAEGPRYERAIATLTEMPGDACGTLDAQNAGEDGLDDPFGIAGVMHE